MKILQHILSYFLCISFLMSCTSDPEFGVSVSPSFSVVLDDEIIDLAHTSAVYVTSPLDTFLELSAVSKRRPIRPDVALTDDAYCTLLLKIVAQNKEPGSYGKGPFYGGNQVYTQIDSVIFFDQTLDTLYRIGDTTMVDSISSFLLLRENRLSDQYIDGTLRWNFLEPKGFFYSNIEVELRDIPLLFIDNN